MAPHPKKRANYLHGSYPVQSRTRAASKLGVPPVRQHSALRHYALATVCEYTFVTADGAYFNTPFFAETRDYQWLEQNKLIERDMTLGRNQRSWPIRRTEDGDRVLACWNTKHGDVDIWEGQ